jgi:flagellar assembly protein FliH
MASESGNEIETYGYPAGPEPSLSIWGDLKELNPISTAVPQPDPPQPREKAAMSSPIPIARSESEIAAEVQRSFEAGRKRGLEEGRIAEREAQSAARSAEERRRAEQLAALSQNFAMEREKYLHDVEHEVVELALAVAARILRREAQMDPLLLTGAVRVALGQLSNTTKVTLRVPDAELGLWKDAVALIPNLSIQPAVQVGDGLRLGDCIIETELGSVDLGVRAQLGEIERGFFDRTGRKEASGLASATASEKVRP